jgi:thiamine biosynthesis lipoprotein
LHRPTNPGLIYLPLLCLLLLAACDNQPQLVEVRILQFGTVIDVSLVHEDQAEAEQSLSDIEKRLAEYRQNWHAWEDSDLSRFNRSLASSRAATIPSSLAELIGLSHYYYLRSNRLFNPALGKLIGAYGFHGSVEPDQATISAIQKNMPSMSDLKIKGQLATSDNEHLQLDFGGIAKGYAAGLIADQLQRQGYENFLISAGGDIVTSGSKFGKAWRVGVQNPFEAGAIARIELLGRHSLFTSGDYQRFYSKDNNRIHHIIDPRSGNPSEQISSATVLTTDPVLADVGATTLMIDGLKNSRSLSQSLGIDDYMIVNEDREIIISRSLADKLELIEDWPVYIID